MADADLDVDAHADVKRRLVCEALTLGCPDAGQERSLKCGAADINIRRRKAKHFSIDVP